MHRDFAKLVSSEQEDGWTEMVRYRGQFLEPCGRVIADAARKGSLGNIPPIVVDLNEILHRRSKADLHKIAVLIDGVVQRQASHEAAGCGPAVVQAGSGDIFAGGALQRYGRCEVDLWLAAGAEQSWATEAELQGFPDDVRPSEYLAVMALWKAVDLHRASQVWLRTLSADASFAAESLFLSKLQLRLLVIRQLAAELARAGTLASQLAYLEGQLALEHTIASHAARHALQAAADHPTRQATTAARRKWAAAIEQEKLSGA